MKRLLSSLVALAPLFVAAPANAQFAFSFGGDGGITMTDPRIRFKTPTVQQRNANPTVALGLDLAAYYLPDKDFAFGVALSPSFFMAGPEPSPGINFAFGPRLVWRPGAIHVAFDAEAVLSAYEDRCQQNDFDAERPDCPTTLRSASSAAGFGVGLAPLIRVAKLDALDILVGPAFRYQFARYDITNSTSTFLLADFQVVAGIRVFYDTTITRPSPLPPPPPVQF